DGATDYPADPGCETASDGSEIDDCIIGVPVLSLDPAGVNGTTSGSSTFTASCGFPSGPEDVYSYTLDRDDLISITFSTLGSSLDTVTYVRLGDCGNASAEIACADPSNGGEAVTINDPAQGTYFVFVDGSFGASGSYVLEATGIIPGYGACDPGDTQFVCESGYYCDVDTCTPATCNDSTDNDGDGNTDYPADPGCASPSDNDETDDCPSGPTCPVCANGVDDDGDGLTDYPNDPG